MNEELIEELESLEIDGEQPAVFTRNGEIYISGEEGDGLVEYWGYKDYPHIDREIENIATKYDGFWEWETPGCIVFCKN